MQIGEGFYQSLIQAITLGSIGHTVAACGYLYSNYLKEIFVQDSAFNRINVLKPGPVGVFR